MQRPSAAPLSRYWAGAMILLICATYRLWVPPAWTQTEFYPAVAFWECSPALVSGVSSALLPVIGLALAVILVCAQRIPLQRIAWLAIAMALALGFSTDQHRLQPWAYQSFLYACWFALLPQRWWLATLRALTISIYFYSAVGKLDYQFLHTVGQDFLTTGSRWLLIDVSQWGQQARLTAASLFPLSELAIACMLMLPRTRLLGGWFAIAMHLTVLLLLSPLGMNHSLGVLAWNVVLAGQAYLLFVHPSGKTVPVPPPVDEVIRFPALRWTIAVLLLLLALGLPLTERRGRSDWRQWHWDHWLSWALYSPHNSRVQVEIHGAAVDDLPPPIGAAVSEDSDGDSWFELDLGELSLQARGVPILPQARYQLQLAIAIAKREGWTHQVRAVLRSASDRRGGSREEHWMNRLEAMQQAAERFR